MLPAKALQVDRSFVLTAALSWIPCDRAARSSYTAEESSADRRVSSDSSAIGLEEYNWQGVQVAAFGCTHMVEHRSFLPGASTE